MSRLHALHKTVEFHGAIESRSRGEAGANPQRIDRFDKHSAGADVARTSPQDRGTPLDLEVCAERVARSPAPFESSGWMAPPAHEPVATPGQVLRPPPPP